MADVETRVREVRTKLEAAGRDRARSEVALSSAVAARDAARVRLKDEFGVETSEQARAVREDLQRALEAALSEVEGLLEQAMGVKSPV